MFQNGIMLNPISGFESKLAFGNVAEKQIEAWLIQVHHFLILPAYEGGRNQKGPRLFSDGKSLITPDILAIRGQYTRWIEAKHKTHFTWYRAGKSWCTGIDSYLYRDYLQVAQLSGWPVWLLFLHSRSDSADGICPTGLFGGNIQRLNGCVDHVYKPRNRGGMIYWKYSSLEKLATIEAIEGMI